MHNFKPINFNSTLEGYFTFKSLVHGTLEFIRKNKNHYKNHIIGWSIYFFIDVLFTYVISTPFDGWVYIENVIFIIVFFYAVFFISILPNVENDIIKTIIVIILLLFPFIFIKLSFDSFFWNFPVGLKKYQGSYWRYFSIEIWRFLTVSLYAIAYWVFRQSLKEQKLRLLADLKLKETEEALLRTEIKFLKAQVNPHFLFNTLNFFYSETYRLSPQLGEGILGLTEILRYTVQSTQNEEIHIEKEAAFLHKYIGIQQLRFHNKLQIDLETEILAPEMMVPPLIILTFVENAFKYGKMNDPANPLIIRLSSDHQKITFYCKNLISNQFRDPSTSVGIENIKIRLDRHCKDYQLAVTNDETFYTVNLQINLA